MEDRLICAVGHSTRSFGELTEILASAGATAAASRRGGASSAAVARELDPR